MPWKSKAQQRALHAKAARGEVKQSVVNEFDAATKGKFSSLPERVKKKRGRKK